MRVGPAPGMIRVRGIGRLLRASGGVGAFVLLLLWARARLPARVDQWVEAHPAHQSPFIAVPLPQWEVTLGKVQPLTCYLLFLAMVAASLAYQASDALLRRWRSTRVVADVLAGVAVGAALVMAYKASPFLGKLSLAAVAPLALVLGACDLEPRPLSSAADRSPSGAGSGIVLVVESLALGWGLWLTWWTSRPLLALLVATALGAAATVRAAKLLATPEGKPGLARLALAGAPLLPVPLLGLAKDPSPWWLFGFLICCAAIALAQRRRPRQGGARALRLLTAIGAPLTLVAIAMIPMGFRELEDINHLDHEGQHLGWVNSQRFGKWMMADAGFVYGPLREYISGVIGSVGGLTLEHMREGQIVECLIGSALLLYAGWRVSRERPWMQLVWALMVVVFTPVSNFVDYHGTISFGWANLIRTGLPCLAIVGAMNIVSGSKGVGPVTDKRRLLGWGALCGVAILYSQDFGACAFGAVLGAIIADSLVRRRVGRVGERVRRAAELAGVWLLGAGGVVLLFLLVYAAAGRGPLVLRRLMWTILCASGSWFARPFPLHAADFLSSEGLLAIHDHWPAIVYSVPIAVALVTIAILARVLARGRWNARASLLFALLLFCATSIMPVLVHCDIDHIHSDGTGGLLLLFVLMCSLVDMRWRFGRQTIPVGALAVLVLAYGWMTEGMGLAQLEQRMRAVVAGTERPSTGPPHVYPGIPRAGDVIVPQDIVALVHFVQKHTSRRDPVWVITGALKSGELAFVMERNNPTPFDTEQEQLGFEDQKEVLEDITRTPPVFIVGDYLDACSAETRAFVAAHYKPAPVPGYAGTVLRYDATTGATP